LVKSTSNLQPVTLSNTGNSALAVANIATAGNFAQTNNCGTSVTAGGSCTINVTFTPLAGGPLTGTLTVTDNSNGTTGSTQTVSLSGTGQDFTLAVASGSSSSQNVSPGQAATYTLSAGGEGGFSQSVAFTCVGAPSESTCTVSPNPATVGNSAATITVSVTTTAPSSIGPRFLLGPRFHRPQALLMLALLLTGFACTFSKWRRVRANHWQTALLPIAAGLLLTFLIAACGGGGGGGGGGGPTNPGTPAGTYTLTVTGKVGSGSTALSHNVTLTLNVS
jgi:hypothetical protein